MASPQELEQFLQSVERRAFKLSVYHVRNEDAAMDITQDAMIKLATKYGDKPVAELGPLFTRILQTTTLDYFRREKVKNAWVVPFSSFTGDGDEELDPLEIIEAQEGTAQAENVFDKLSRAEVLAKIDDALQSLPLRQREAFVLRYWEEYDVAETAKLMNCSEGSVKTHCFRATQTLQKHLEKLGITL